MRIQFSILLLPVLWSSSALAATCERSEPGVEAFFTSAWGIDLRNTRLQADTRIDASNVNDLELAWVYGLANSAPRFWPLVTEDTIFVGDSGNGLVALDRETGCTRWTRPHAGEIASAILHAQIAGRTALVFNDRNSGTFAVDARDGELIWHAEADDQAVPMYSGSPIIGDNTVFVPLSSLEIGLVLNPLYGCCTTSGGMTAFDLETGEKRWYRSSIPRPAEVTGRRYLFVESRGPSGAPVWGAPTLDQSRGLVYFGTGQNYSHPATATSDSIFALEIDTGEVRWIHQATSGDAWNLACGLGGPSSHPNCPDPMGPDLDFGAPPILVRTGTGEDILLAGQKSGDIWAIDPDTGEVIWQQLVGRGGALGGVHWGLAANEAQGLLFVPVSDTPAFPRERQPSPGLYALDIETGQRRWEYQSEARCDSCWGGLSSAITATPDLLFSTTLDGYVRAHDINSGDVVWSHDTWRDYETVNDVAARGGSIDTHGPMVADDLLIVVSGYAAFSQEPGNAVLVFKLER